MGVLVFLLPPWLSGVLLRFSASPFFGLAASSVGQSETETELKEGEAAGNQVLVEQALESRVARGARERRPCRNSKNPRKCRRQNTRKNKPDPRPKKDKGKGKGEGKGKGKGKGKGSGRSNRNNMRTSMKQKPQTKKEKKISNKERCEN